MKLQTENPVSLEHCLYAARLVGDRKEKPYCLFELHEALFPNQKMGIPKTIKQIREVLEIGTNTGFFERAGPKGLEDSCYKLTSKGFTFLHYYDHQRTPVKELRQIVYGRDFAKCGNN